MHAIQENEHSQLQELTSFLALETNFVRSYLDVLLDVKESWQGGYDFFFVACMILWIQAKYITLGQKYSGTTTTASFYNLLEPIPCVRTDVTPLLLAYLQNFQTVNQVQFPNISEGDPLEVNRPLVRRRDFQGKRITALSRSQTAKTKNTVMRPNLAG